MVVTHSQETCARNLHKFLAQVSLLYVTTIKIVLFNVALSLSLCVYHSFATYTVFYGL